MKMKICHSENSEEIDFNIEESPNKLTLNKSLISSVAPLLSDIKPEKWNNIPHPLVECIKLLIKDSLNKDKRFESHILKYDEFVQKSEFQRSRLEKEIEKHEEGVDSKVLRLEKNTNNSFNNLRKQTENEITLIKKKMENMEIDLNSAINQIKMKLSKMDETKIVRAFVEETVKQSEFDIKTYATKAVQDLEDKLSEEARQRFQVDKLIGQKEVYPSFEEF
jgi:hypothetical protein